MAVLVLLLLFLAVTTEVLSQGERATLPLTLQPRPLQGGCPSQDEISEIHDEVRSVLQDTVEPIRRQAGQDLNGTNSSDFTHCWVDHTNGGTQHCFSGEQWNKLQDDIKKVLYTELQGELMTKIQDLLWNITEQIQNDLHSEITQVQSDFNQNITQLESTIAEALHLPLASSCKQLAETNPYLPSGYYSVYLNGTVVPTYCDMDRHGCYNTGRWTRVVYLNMTDPTHQCPSAWREITSPIRTCGRGADTRDCESVIFSTNGIQYSYVVGRVRGYQFGEPEAFNTGSEDINYHYLDGVSITHGTSHEHIWSFAAERNDNVYCPCGSTYTTPSFVGEDYYCDSGTVDYAAGQVFYQDDLLWDGQGCGRSTCCTYNNPPWFCKQLSQAATDDIEIRLCNNGLSGGGEDTPIELIEIFIQ